jgi:hypothetical protein
MRRAFSSVSPVIVPEWLVVASVRPWVEDPTWRRNAGSPHFSRTSDMVSRFTYTGLFRHRKVAWTGELQTSARKSAETRSRILMINLLS